MNTISIDKLSLAVKDYDPINRFIKNYSKLTYIEFDHYSMDKLNLFTVHENFDFASLEKTIDKIVEVIPAIKRIFAKPIIHLIDQDTILPVESVKKINNETIIHASFHSELWEDVTDKQIKPRKLLTKNNIDNYSIYENVAFAHLINCIMGFCRRNIRFLKDFIYTNNSLNFNILERVDHINYFLSLGKLHTGYIRNFEKNYPIIDRCINKLNFIYTTITARLKRPVYKKNATKDKNGFILKNTNILKMHKDYHKVYLLLKYFSTNNIIVSDPIDENSLNKMQNAYYNYSKLLSIFSLLNFGLECSKYDILDLEKLDSDFKTNGWTINLKEKEIDKVKFLRFDCLKDIHYRFVLIPCANPSNFDNYLNTIKEKERANMYVILSPFEDFKNTTFISINNIDSFRRIQQFIFKALIYSDKNHETCPFCLESLDRINNNGIIHYECSTCRNVIQKIECEECNQEYYATSIKDYKSFVDFNKKISNDNAWLFNRNVEASMHYRNITAIDANMDLICPCCGNTHKI